jgi:single-strand DNA-binding protein
MNVAKKLKAQRRNKMLNNWSGVGRLTKKPGVKIIGDNKAVCNFTLAVNRPYKDKDGEYQADFIQCQAWGSSAKFLADYIEKGALVAVTGAINTRSYDNDKGDRVYITEVNVSTVQSLEKKKDAGNKESVHNYKDVDEAKRAWKTEYEMQSVGLDTASKENLKKQLAKKYQPIVDELDTDSPY